MRQRTKRYFPFNDNDAVGKRTSLPIRYTERKAPEFFESFAEVLRQSDPNFDAPEPAGERMEENMQEERVHMSKDVHVEGAAEKQLPISQNEPAKGHVELLTESEAFQSNYASVGSSMRSSGLSSSNTPESAPTFPALPRAPLLLPADVTRTSQEFAKSFPDTSEGECGLKSAYMRYKYLGGMPNTTRRG